MVIPEPEDESAAGAAQSEPVPASDGGNAPVVETEAPPED